MLHILLNKCQTEGDIFDFAGNQKRLHVDPCLFTEHCYWLFTVIKRHYYVIIPNFFPIIVAYSI